MKSFLSLERSATFICRKAGVERKYLVYEGEEFVNYDLIHSCSTTEENGVKCELLINDYSEYLTFSSKARQKLAYYDTAVLIIDGNIILNDIHRSDDFQWSSLNKNDHVHLCLKDVYYSIDYEALGIPPIRIGLALRFDLKDGIIPTPSRESYITNDKTKKLILAKIAKVADWLIDKYNEDIKPYDTFADAYNYIGNTDYYVMGKCINSIIPYSKKKITPLSIKGIVLQTPDFYKSIRYHFLTGYEVVAQTNSSREYISGRRLRYYSKETHCMIDKAPTVIVDSFVGNIKQYLKEKSLGNTLFLRRSPSYKLPLRAATHICLYDILNLKNIKKQSWRKYVEEFNFVLSTISSTFVDQTDVVNSPAYTKWLNEKKEEQKQQRLLNTAKGIYNGINKKQGDVTLAYSYQGLRGTSFKKQAYPISSLFSNKFLTVLIPDDYDDLVNIKKAITCMKTSTCFATVGKNEMKKVPKHYQFININQFMSRDCKPFMRLASALVFKQALDDLRNIKGHKQGLFYKFVAHLKKDEEILQKYVNNNLSSFNSEVAQSVITVAEKYNLYDKSLWENYLRLKESCKKYDFINLLTVPSSWDKEHEKQYNKLIYQVLLFRRKYYKEEVDGINLDELKTSINI